MLKYHLFLFSFIFIFSVNSQSTIIKTQNFDETAPSWGFTTDIPFFDHGSDGFFGVHNGDNDDDTNDTGISTKASSLNFINIENDFLFINDLNDEGDNGTNSNAVILFNDVDLGNYRNVHIAFDYEIVDFGTTDFIKYEIIEDGISTLVEELPKNGTDSSFINIKNSTKILSFKFIIKQNGQSDFAGIDNITIEGQLLNPCNELLISEYVEGSSSTSHRNNFIEIYNPTSSAITLDTYDLTKYTGKSTVVSNVLELTGIIPAYGTFLIEDSKENLAVTADLSTNNAVMDFTGDDKIALRSFNNIIDLIGVIGDSINFAKDVTLRRKSNIQNPNNQFNYSEWDIYDLEELGNINTHVSNCSGPIPEIEVSGNYQLITDGSKNTSSKNNTYFGTVSIESEDEIIKSFYIKNLGNSALNMSNISLTGDINNYSILTVPPNNIQPLDSFEISIRFIPTTKGIKTAVVNIENNDDSENPYDFVIQGEGSSETDSPLMITQYYEGTGNNKWIEITNISDSPTLENTYFVALFWNEDAKNPINIKPSRNKAIPALVAGEIVKYQSTLTVTEPDYALDGNEIKSSICNFTGDDILIISTTNDITSWENRLDIIGADTLWGKDISYLRKYGCEVVKTNTGFNPLDWFIYEIVEINNAIVDSNLRIGNHFIGSTSFTTDNIWDNGIPDKYRTAIINQNFDTFELGNLEACNLIINPGKIASIKANNYIDIFNNLTVNGFLEIQHEGTLYMVNNNGAVINNGKIKIHKTTTTLKINDYTYWSSPVKKAELSSVFEASPQNSFYSFETKNYSDTNYDNLDDDGNAWVPVSGSMEAGKGYTAMAPNTNPFIDKQSVIFEGIVNNGIINVPVDLSNDDTNDNDDWNLIGNPYPSAISADLFLSDNYNKTLLNGSIYYWTHNTSANIDNDNNPYSSDDYAIYNIGTGGIKANSQGELPTGIIASGQGFFVEAIQSGNIMFKNEMRLKLGNDNFFKTEYIKNKEIQEKEKVWLNISNDQGAFSQILVGFMAEASKRIESKYDSPRLDGNKYLSFYSIEDNQHLAIQGTNSVTGEEVIPLGFSSLIKEKITLKIGIDHLEGKLIERDIFLVDKLLRKTHNLKISDYSFSSEEQGIFDDRFYLKFGSSLLLNEELINIKEELIVNRQKDLFSIKTNINSILESIKLFDILGRIVFIAEPYQKEYSLNHQELQSSGIFIIYVELSNGKILTKKVIK